MHMCFIKIFFHITNKVRHAVSAGNSRKKEPWKPKYYRSILLSWICLNDPTHNFLLKRCLLLIRQNIQIRAQPGTAVPLHYTFVGFHHMIIGGLPDIKIGSDVGQNIKILPG